VALAPHDEFVNSRAMVLVGHDGNIGPVHADIDRIDCHLEPHTV
jgi:hypothetical protein